MLEIREVGIGYLQSEISLIKLAFNETDALCPTHESMRHKYDDNPANVGAMAFGAFDQDRLAGLCMYMPAWYQFGNMKLFGVQACDAAVDPEYQRRGLFTQITEAAELYYSNHDVDFFLACPTLTVHSYPAFKRRGLVEVAHCKYAHIPLNISMVVEEKFSVKLPQFIDDVCWAMRLRLLRRAKRNKQLRIEKDRASFLTVSGDYSDERIRLDIGQDVLNWRCSGDKFFYYTIFEGKRAIAQFIVKKIGVVAVVIEHCFFIETVKKRLEAVSLLAKEARVGGFGVLSFWTALGTPDMETFVRAGAIKYDNSKHGIPYMVKVLTEDPEKAAVLNNLALWQPMRIELDTVIDNFDTTKYERHFFR